jgi:hypothetical protein
MNPHESEPRPAGTGFPTTDDERQFLSNLLDTLAREDRVAHDLLLEANPDLADTYGEADRLRERIRAALTDPTAAGRSVERTASVERARAAGVRAGPPADVAAASPSADDPDGILTSLTRHLPPEKAIALYHKIAPAFVYQLLNHLDEGASLRVAHQLVDHLCSAEVQARLRACTHVRDGILDECCAALGRSELRHRPSRDDLQRILVECGAMHDLIAMENCITLVASKAG